MEQMTASAENLSGLSDELRTALGRFKVSIIEMHEEVRGRAAGAAPRKTGRVAVVAEA